MIHFVGLAAGTFVILASHAKDVRWLRGFAITSNVLFVTYGCEVGLWPIVLLHGILFPLNVVRLLEIGAPSVDPSRSLTGFERDELARDLRLALDCHKCRRML